MTWPTALERLRGTVGVWTTTHESLPPERSGDVARALEDMGWAAMWIPEAWGREAFTSSQLLLAATSKIVIATGIANIWGRDAVNAANALRTLTAAYGERFVLGLGVSHQPLVERLRGHDYNKPVAAMRQFLEAMNEAPMFCPEGQVRGARVIAALGPAMLALANSHADGAHPYLVTPAHTATARAALPNGFIGVEQAVVVGADREEFLRRAHAHLEIYTGLDNYKANWRRLGFIEDDFVRGGSERLCDALVVHGDPSTIAQRVEEHREAGADHVCLQVLGADPFTPPYDDWAALAAVLHE